MSTDMKNEVTKKFLDLGIVLLNFNIINISFRSDSIETALLTTQVLDQQIEEMEYMKISKEEQLDFLKQTNVIYDGVNKSIEVTKGEVNKKVASGTGKGKAELYKNITEAMTSIQSATSNLDQTFLFTYMAIFKNTFSPKQNIYVNKNPY